MTRSYEGFLNLPVALVLIVLWLAGSALLASCGLLALLASCELIGYAP